MPFSSLSFQHEKFGTQFHFITYSDLVSKKHFPRNLKKSQDFLGYQNAISDKIGRLGGNFPQGNNVVLFFFFCQLAFSSRRFLRHFWLYGRRRQTAIRRRYNAIEDAVWRGFRIKRNKQSNGAIKRLRLTLFYHNSTFPGRCIKPRSFLFSIQASLLDEGVFEPVCPYYMIGLCIIKVAALLLCGRPESTV